MNSKNYYSIIPDKVIAWCLENTKKPVNYLAVISYLAWKANYRYGEV